MKGTFAASDFSACSFLRHSSKYGSDCRCADVWVDFRDFGFRECCRAFKHHCLTLAVLVTRFPLPEALVQPFVAHMERREEILDDRKVVVPVFVLAGRASLSASIEDFGGQSAPQMRGISRRQSHSCIKAKGRASRTFCRFLCGRDGRAKSREACKARAKADSRFHCS